METKKIILKLRTERGMSQDELANKVMVTRQAVSRWENGDTVPNTDTLRGVRTKSWTKLLFLNYVYTEMDSFHPTIF